MTQVLDPKTRMGLVELRVADLDKVAAYYGDGVGLELITEGKNWQEYGRDGVATLRINHAPELKHAPAGSAGLFHTAVLFETRAQLAAAVYSLARKYPNLFTGSSDHLVSEAFYFDDPEGNGVELYWDKPKDTWQIEDSTIKMATLYLDPNQFLQEHLSATALEQIESETGVGQAARAGDVQLGHVHLRVGDIATAEAFYSGALGFEVTNRYGAQALFVSAGGYHHHLGMNTWDSRGASKRTLSLGLGQASIIVPTLDEVLAVQGRLKDHKYESQFDGATLIAHDPWGNEVLVSAAH